MIMNMKKNVFTLLAGITMLMLAVVVSSCGSKSESSNPEIQKATQEESVAPSDQDAAQAEVADEDLNVDDEYEDIKNAKEKYDEAYEQAKDEYDKAYKQAKDDYDKAYKQAQDDYDKAYKQTQDMLDSYGW